MLVNEIDDLVRTVCRLECGDTEESELATAFLVAPNKVITATHSIAHYFKHGYEIRLEFLNITKAPIIRYATPLNDESCSVSLLEFEDPIDCNCLSFFNYPPKGNDPYLTFGYPLLKRAVGNVHDSRIMRTISDSMSRPFDWDMDLDHDTNLEDFSGLSGAPLIVNRMLVGVFLTEATANGKTISLGAISVPKFRHLLEGNGIKVCDDISYQSIVYEMEQYDYNDFLFLAKLESANIFEHEMCQQEFFNADIYKSSVESRNVKNELNHFKNLKSNLRSIWFTQYNRYKDKVDGNDLLSSVYERVEELDIEVNGVTTDVALFIKKGILHLLAEECKVGWVKNYSMRLEEYLKEKRV